MSPNLGVYHVTKAALIHLTRQLALELAPQVRVNAVAPGIVRTRLSEALWKDDEAQVADAHAAGPDRRRPPTSPSAVAFLASDRASWITGETLVIDGGQLLQHRATRCERSGRHERLTASRSASIRRPWSRGSSASISAPSRRCASRASATASRT